MKKISKLIGFAFILFIALNSVFAFGSRYKFGAKKFIGVHGLYSLSGLGIFLKIVVLFLFVLWIWMIIDCLKRKFKKDMDKIVWILVLIFLHILGAIIYFFVIKSSDKKVKKKSKK